MNDNFYETGSTQPPKSRVLVVFLLVLLIFVGGIITALGVLNIKLWRAVSPEEKDSVSLKFSRPESNTVAQFASPQTAGNNSVGLGVATETVSAFIRTYYHLPQGVYIPRVPSNSHAATAGIQPGDIILALDGHEITDTDTLNKLLHRYHAGDVVTLSLYRDGQDLSVKLTLIEEN